MPLSKVLTQYFQVGFFIWAWSLKFDQKFDYTGLRISHLKDKFIFELICIALANQILPPKNHLKTSELGSKTWTNEGLIFI